MISKEGGRKWTKVKKTEVDRHKSTGTVTKEERKNRTWGL